MDEHFEFAICRAKKGVNFTSIFSRNTMSDEMEIDALRWAD